METTVRTQPAMHTDKREGDIEAVLYQRTELPPPAVERADYVAERLEDIAERSHIDEVIREEWDKREPLHDCDEDLRDAYLSFQSWADERGVRLTPFFQTRECYSPDEEAHTDWLVVPAFCLAVYDEDGVAAVYPHADDAGTMTVEDGLQALLSDGVEGASVEPAAAD